MKKNVIRLNESQLRRMIKETVSEIAGWDGYLSSLERGMEPQEDGLDKAYNKQFKEVLSHLQMAMKIMNQIDPSDYGNYTNEVDDKLSEIYDQIETAAIDIKSFISGDFLTSLYPRR